MFYNNGDYRFKNNTDQAFQLLVWCENEQLCAELRSEYPIKYTYRLVEEGHHFQKEGEKYYRISKLLTGNWFWIIIQRLCMIMN